MSFAAAVPFLMAREAKNLAPAALGGLGGVLGSVGGSKGKRIGTAVGKAVGGGLKKFGHVFGLAAGGRVRRPPVAGVGYRMGGRVAGRRRV
jgi:hypothetical protein